MQRRDFIKTAVLIGGLTGCLGQGESKNQGNSKSSIDRESFPPDQNTQWSEPVQIGEGKAKVFQTTQNEKPKYIGVELTQGVLSGLPDEKTGYHLHVPGESVFEWVGIDWEPHGHIPEGVYTVPHFDLHFYMLEESKVENIKRGPANYSIPKNQIPKDYIRPSVVDTNNDGEPDSPLIIADMGEHLVDPNSPEFNDGSFTHTFIWGAYDPDSDGTGELTFMEPMMTKSFLKQKPEKASRKIKTPDKPPKPGMYPTQYKIRYHQEKMRYTVTLEDFTKL